MYIRCFLHYLSGAATAVAGVLALGLAALASPAKAQVDVRADWENGTAPWDILVCRDTAAQFALVTSPKRQGRYAARFTVRPGDRFRSTSGERCEGELFGNYAREQPGEQHFYAWSTLFPADWVTPTRWGIIFQWHAQTTISPPVGINVTGNTLSVDYCSGNIDNAYPCEKQESFPVLGSLNKGRWNDFIARIKLAPDNSGEFQLWHRLEGENQFRLVFSKLGYPTLQWARNINRIEAPRWAIPTRVNGQAGYTTATYLHHGFYRGDTGTGGPVNTLYHDGLCRGRSYQDVEACFDPLPRPDPIGQHDGADTNTTYGWACDPSNPGAALQVHLYRENGVFLSSVIANQPREASVGQVCGGNANHGWSYTIPAALKDGSIHNIHAYVINPNGGNNPLLGSSPRMLVPPSCQLATSGNWKTLPLPTPLNGVFSMQADLIAPAAPTSGAVSLTAGAPATDAWNDLAATVLLDDVSGNILVRNGGVYSAQNVVRYQAYRNYRLRMQVDVPLRRYSVYVTPAGGSEITLATDYAFRSSQSGVSSLKNWVVSAGVGNFAFAACNATPVVLPPRCVTSTTGAWKSTALPAAQTGQFTLRATATPPAAATSGTIALSSGVPATENWDALAAMVLFDNDTRRILVRNGASYSALVPLTYQAGVAYHLRLVVNVSTRRYSVFVRPEGGNEIALATDYAFRSSQQNVTSLSHWTVGAGGGGVGAFALQACDVSLN